jgi:mediator of RNA polymerase II transcription subunit 16
MENRPSMIYLKRYGELRLRFQQPDSTWHEVTTQLETMVSTREAFSHAAFASYGDKTLLLAAYDVSGRLHLYRIEPKWAVPPKTQQPQQPAKHMDKPELLVTEIRTEDTCYPLGPAIDNLGLNDASPKVRIPAQLTHLSFLPKTPEQDDGTVPTIQAIFSTPPNLVSFDQTQPHQNPYSIVVKWEVHRTQKNLLNPALDQVTSKKKSLSSVPPREVWCMKRLPEIPLHSVVLAFYPLWYSMILAYCYSDGTIELRNRATMEIIAPDYNTETVTSLSQAGFAFPTLEPSLNIALSPNHCIAACMQDDGTIKVHSMEYTHGSLATDDDDPKHAAAVAAAVLEVCSAGNQYLSSDDIFSVMGDISEKRKSDFIRIMLQGLNINVDCSTDETNYLMLMGRSPFFIKTLSAHHLLGLQPGVQRSVPSMIAWMSLNIKFVTSILTSMTRLHQPLDKSILPAQMVPMMIGICRWIMHFMVYLVDELFAIGYELRNNPPQTLDRATFEATINTLNKPALLVLLSSFPRRMMGLWEQTLKWITNTAMRIGNSSNAHRDVRRIYEPLSQTFTTTPMSYHHFAQLVMETHGLVRQAYHRASLTDAQRNHAETELILGRLPDVLFPVAKHIVTDLLFNDKRETGCLADKVDIAKIMFFDTTWLGLTSSNSATQWHKSHVVDVCQKMIIRGSGAQSHPLALASKGSRARSDSVGAAGGGGGVFSDEKKYSKERLRQCLRCSARTEDVLSGMPGYSQHHVAWLGSVTKNCVCGSSWTLVEWPERNDEQ